jgi:hypothetical protein
MSIVGKFLEFSSQIKLYHWQTKVYARHKASDKLYNNINPLIDQFIEILQGKYQTRVSLQKSENGQIKNLDDDDIIFYLQNFKEFLVEDLPKSLDQDMKNYDLLNIRDEMLALINQSLYLFSLH